MQVRAENDEGWSFWTNERPGTPAPRPPTSLRITTSAQDGVSAPFRVTFTFTDEDHGGTRYGVEGFTVDDIEANYSGSGGPITLNDFRVERPGFVYSALVDRLLDAELTIYVPAGAARSSASDGQQSTEAVLYIDVEVEEDEAPRGSEIWSAEMTVGEYTGNAAGYINKNLSLWDESHGSLDDVDFTYGGTSYTVGEVSFVPAWGMVIFVVCPGIVGANAAFDLYLDDEAADGRDHTLSFDPDEEDSFEFTGTIGGNQVTCTEYHWYPRQVDWEDGGKVGVRLVR